MRKERESTQIETKFKKRKEGRRFVKFGSNREDEVRDSGSRLHRDGPEGMGITATVHSNQLLKIKKHYTFIQLLIGNDMI